MCFAICLNLLATTRNLASDHLVHWSQPSTAGPVSLLIRSVRSSGCTEFRSTRQLHRQFIEGHSLDGPLDDSKELIFYTHTLCPYAQRVWLTLLEKEVDFYPVQIDLSDKPPFYRSICSLVPAISHLGTIVTESIDICNWIDESLEGPSLVPSEQAGRQAMSALVSSSSTINSAGLSLLAGRSGRSWGIGEGQSEAQRRSFEAQLRRLDGVLSKFGGPFLFGERVSLADLIIFPFMERFALAKEFTGYDVHDALGGSIGAWLSSMAERPSCKMASANSTLLLEAFRKHRSLDFFDYTTYMATELHPHLIEPTN
ncbi:probable protein IN2-1 homolog B [Coccomyxa sp. Obi]|nr:probable protein IN2-1 homolog B [Coccomyxa sp. Obi]